MLRRETIWRAPISKPTTKGRSSSCRKGSSSARASSTITYRSSRNKHRSSTPSC
jgi:hypothetical protein